MFNVGWYLTFNYKQDNDQSVTKDKYNSLLIIKLGSGTVAGGTVTGGVSSVDFNETFSFCAAADLFRYHFLSCT